MLFMQDASEIFRMRGSAKCLDGPIFEGQDKILLFGEGLKFGVIFSKICMKIIKILEIMEKKFHCLRPLRRK